MNKEELGIKTDTEFLSGIIHYFYSMHTFKLGVNLLLNHFKVSQDCEITYEEDFYLISVNIKPKCNSNFYIFNYIDLHMNKVACKINSNHSLYINGDFVINHLHISLIEYNAL